MNAMSEEELQCAVMLEGRAYIYTLLAKACGGEPTDELFGWLADERTAEAFGLFASADETLGRCGDYLAARFGDLGGEAADDLFDRCVSERSSVFYGFPSVKAVPSESYYRASDHALLSEVTLSVRERYRRAGLKAARYPRIPDDGLGLELAFMAQLAARTADSFADGDRRTVVQLLIEQSAFLGDHLGEWVPSLSEDLQTVEGSVLYPQLVRALEAFIPVDEQLINNVAQWMVDAAADGPAQTPASADAPQAEDAPAAGSPGVGDDGSEPATSSRAFAGVTDSPETAASCETLGRLREAVARLQSLHLPNSEENELVPLAD